VESLDGRCGWLRPLPVHGASVLREVVVGNDDPFKGSVSWWANCGRGLPDHLLCSRAVVRAASSLLLFHLVVGLAAVATGSVPGWRRRGT